MRGKRIREPSNRSWHSIIRWPAFLLANLALLFIIGASTVRETYHGWTVDREIHALEAQAAALEGRRLDLQRLAEDLVSPERVEYEARAKLDRKKPGEHVVVLEGFSSSTTWSGDPTVVNVTPETSTESSSNPRQWFQYFFPSY